jgi:nitroreductase
VEFTEVIKRRKMVRAFKAEPLPPGTAERLLRAANRAPSAGFSQGYSFLVLEGAGASAAASPGGTTPPGPPIMGGLSGPPYPWSGT